MSGRAGVLVHGVLLLLAMGLAWQTWTREPVASSPTAELYPVEVWSGRPAEIESVVLTAVGRTTTLERRAPGGLWITIEREVSPARASDAGAGAEPTEPIRTTFAAGVERTQKLLDQLAPLRARRSIGKVTGNARAEYGLDDPKLTLAVTLAGAVRSLKLGGTVYRGGGRYALDERTGEAFVVDGGLVNKLRDAEARLMRRKLHDFTPGRVAGARILYAGAERRRPAAKDGGRRVWTDAATPDRKDEGADGWMRKLGKLQALAWLPTAPSGLEQVLRVEYQGADGQPLGHLVLARAPTEKGEPDYLASTEVTGGLVRISRKTGALLAEGVEALLTSPGAR